MRQSRRRNPAYPRLTHAFGAVASLPLFSRGPQGGAEALALCPWSGRGWGSCPCHGSELVRGPDRPSVLSRQPNSRTPPGDALPTWWPPLGLPTVPRWDCHPICSPICGQAVQATAGAGRFVIVNPTSTLQLSTPFPTVFVHLLVSPLTPLGFKLGLQPKPALRLSSLSPFPDWGSVCF